MRMGEAASVSGNGPSGEDQGFVHLRVRSAYSLLEGAIKADAIGGLAQAAQMPAVAIADRANLFGALEFSVATKGAGVQPIGVADASSISRRVCSSCKAAPVSSEILSTMRAGVARGASRPIQGRKSNPAETASDRVGKEGA